MHILGVDEAGRGPLAGPLAVGIVRVPVGLDVLGAFPGLNDSKKLSEKKRETLFARIEAHEDVLFEVEWVTAAQIDEQGLTAPIQEAIARGVRSLGSGKVFLDGLLHAPKEYEQETVTGGDGIVPAIMLASIVAKVSRDRLMQQLDRQYPVYGFAQHKGYGTKAHYMAIQQHGLSKEHRRLFLRNL